MQFIMQQLKEYVIFLKKMSPEDLLSKIALYLPEVHSTQVSCMHACMHESS